MRLIDADALMQRLGITDMDCDKCAWYDKKWTRCKRGRDFEDACCAIEDAPTITQNPDEWCVDCKEYDGEKHCCPRFNHVIRKAMERKKGKWLDYTDEGYVECPFCHSATNCEDNKAELHYCFSCGARMESGA